MSHWVGLFFCEAVANVTQTLRLLMPKVQNSALAERFVPGLDHGLHAYMNQTNSLL